MPPLGQTWWREFQSNLCALKWRFDHIARCDQVGGQDGANLTLLQRKAALDVVLVNWKDSKQLQCQTVNADYRHRQMFSMPMVNKWFDFHEPSWDLLVPDVGQRNSKLKGKDRLPLPDRIFRIKTVYEQASKNITLSELGEAHEGMSSEPCSHCSSWTDSAGAASAITRALCGQKKRRILCAPTRFFRVWQMLASSRSLQNTHVELCPTVRATITGQYCAPCARRALRMC